MFTILQTLRKQSGDNFTSFMIVESVFLFTISGRIVNGEGGELRVAFIRSLLRTSRAHVSAVGCFLSGLPLSHLTGGAVGDTSCTRDLLLHSVTPALCCLTYILVPTCTSEKVDDIAKICHWQDILVRC